MGLFDLIGKIVKGPKPKPKRKHPAKPRRAAKGKSPGKAKISKPKKALARKSRAPKKKIVGAPKRKPADKPLGVVTHYFGKISVGVIKLKAPLKVGDKIHIKGAHDDFVQAVQSMQVNHRDVAQAKRGEVGIQVTQRVHENDKVYKAPAV